MQYAANRRITGVSARGVVAGLIAALALGSASAVSAAPLQGTFKISPGANPPGTTGSYFRMIFPGGSANGAFIGNGSSTASDNTYTYLSPGTDGGFVTGGYQPEPSPAFDGLGNSLAARIIAPQGFFGLNFSADSAAIDPQTALAVPAPAISESGGVLSGDIRAWGASWNNNEFNQGAPKPDGSTPGVTAGPTGTYNPTTKAYTLDWLSLIVGGPFNGFTGKWHLAGTFVPRVALPGKGLALGDNADVNKRKLIVQSKDVAVTIGNGNGNAGDPTVEGATIRVVSSTFDNTYSLAAAQWTLIGKPGDNKGYKYKNPTGPFKTGQLKPGKPGKPGTLKFSAKGALGHTLASDPGSVSVLVDIGGQTFWSQYGGTTAFKAGKSFKAKNAPAPTGNVP